MFKGAGQSIHSGNGCINAVAGRDVYISTVGDIPTKLIDKEIQSELDKLRKSRFFAEFDRIDQAHRFGNRLTSGDLRQGGNTIKSRALTWCARLLAAGSDKLPEAEGYLAEASKLSDLVEIKIAEAFILSRKEGKNAAFQALSPMKSAASNSAILFISSNHDGAEKALIWLSDAGLKVEDLDSDGKSHLLNQQLILGQWNNVTTTLDSLSEIDFQETPILHHLYALGACRVYTRECAFAVNSGGRSLMPLASKANPQRSSQSEKSNPTGS